MAPHCVHFRASQAHPLPTGQLMQLHPHICRGLSLYPPPPQLKALFCEVCVCCWRSVCACEEAVECEREAGGSRARDLRLINHRRALMTPCCFPNVSWQRRPTAGTRLTEAHIWLPPVSDRPPFMCAAPRGGCHQPHTSAAAGEEGRRARGGGGD